MSSIFPSLTNYPRLRTALLLLLFFFFAYCLYVGYAPVQKLQSLETALKKDTSERNPGHFAPSLAALYHDQAYRKALVELSADDSVGLILDLKDSLVALSIHGVIIHRVKISSFELDPLLSRMSGRLQIALCAKPLPLLATQATIVKEPVVVRQAPKDTLEAALRAFQPDTLVQNPAFVKVNLPNGIVIFFEQDEDPDYHNRKIHWQFRFGYLMQRAGKSLVKFLTFHRSDYQPYLVVQLPVDQLRAIYRALPHEAEMVLMFP